jgi:hypothetical protein
MAGGRIVVPMPTSDGFGGEHIRDKFVKQYGEASVTRAETAVLTNILIALGIIHKSDFIDMLDQVLKKTDERRRRQAGLND